MQTSQPQDEQILQGGARTHVTRRGDLVFREARPWTPSVHALLKYLEEAEFPYSPRVASSGFDEQGRETLHYIKGKFVHPGPWGDEALIQIGQQLRQLHDLTASFPLPTNTLWQPWFLRELGGEKRIIGHGDLAPWNTLTRDGLPIAFIDWEYAGPLAPLVELARVCWLFTQLHDDDIAAMQNLPPAETRFRQLRLLVDAYGLFQTQRQSMFERIIEVAISETANDAIECNVTPSSEGPLWGLAWRARAAAWMLRHRGAIERALS